MTSRSDLENRNRATVVEISTESLISTLYAQTPLETVARHEAGHAVMAVLCGGYVKRIILGRGAAGEHFGHAFWAIPQNQHSYLLVLSGGVLALYLHNCPSGATFHNFCTWTSTLEGRVMALSGASDWTEILKRTDQPKGYDIDDFLERAVRPYFNEALSLLAKAAGQVNGLTELVLTQPPGVGRRSLNRFFAGRPRSHVAEWLDRPGVLRAVRAELRERGSAT